MTLPELPRGGARRTPAHARDDTDPWPGKTPGRGSAL